MFNANVSLQGNLDLGFDNVVNDVVDGARDAAKHYQSTLVGALERNVGSVAIGGNLRRTIAISRVGGIPYLQTGNLANSITFSESGNFTARGKYIFRVSTRVKYSKALERGGFV